MQQKKYDKKNKCLKEKNVSSFIKHLHIGSILKIYENNPPLAIFTARRKGNDLQSPYYYLVNLLNTQQW